MGDSPTNTETVWNNRKPTMEGWLCKWTNCFKGYQRRWIVLQDGHLSYFRKQADTEHKCRGSMPLRGASIRTEDARTFFVTSNGDTQTFHLKAASREECQQWITALELAKD
ncbi:oxysterol-binding protein 1-like isoform X2 [Photinus pyralis]|uniref:oxysterol-binding protein 1-like isoform X2 n=1 Tax=Photinus pyralis TaxID=7054 RepID=UPI0012674413|nr:oxysterol-binding protein 1-like isoform X2 [Photinus pyralis]XP_031359374.1 oxysterol-binding protein 1-like isoform X2 [Photinus pyralis]